MARAADDPRERTRAVWESGDWDVIAPSIAAAGPRLLVRIGDVGPGVRLLDVGTGSGVSVAIPAAVRGAQVTGCDLVGQWLIAARGHADAAGVEVEWVVGDAADLPFADDSFDVVTSTFGHMFAPDQDAAARELVRVCRPGGTIGLCCWTPHGLGAGLFKVISEYVPPPPPGFRPPVLWGSESHVSALLEPLGVTLQLRREIATVRFASTEQWLAIYEESFGPMVTAKAAVGDRWPEARAAILDYADSINRGEDGAMAHEYEYLETIGRVAGGDRASPRCV